MNVADQPAGPNTLRLGPEGREVQFALRTDLVALHGPPHASAGTSAVFGLPDAGIEVVALGDVVAGESRRRGPVYAQESSGALAVPTGRVFLRLRTKHRPSDWVASLVSHGFVPVEGHADAPGTAWVASADGRIAAGLARLGELSALPDVEAAEPELLRESRRR